MSSLPAQFGIVILKAEFAAVSVTPLFAGSVTSQSTADKSAKNITTTQVSKEVHVVHELEFVDIAVMQI